MTPRAKVSYVECPKCESCFKVTKGAPVPPHKCWAVEKERARLGPRCGDPSCKGWLHMNEPHEIQRCDECARFEYDEDARAAHKVECGCDWPDVAPRHDPFAEDTATGHNGRCMR